MVAREREKVFHSTKGTAENLDHKGKSKTKEIVAKKWKKGKFFVDEKGLGKVQCALFFKKV